VLCAYDVIEVGSYEEINLRANSIRHFNKDEGKNVVDNSFLYEVNRLTAELRKVVYITIEMWR
jgi:hypothetical protein